jgi:HEPN domain-containing protein
MVDVPLTDEQVKKTVLYWADLAEYDFKTAEVMFEGGRYPYALYMCHLSLEKMLKALVTQKIQGHPDYTHNLVHLARLTELSLSDAQYLLLTDMRDFNIEARYPEAERDFYKKATKDYTATYMTSFKELYVWLQIYLQK